MFHGGAPRIRLYFLQVPGCGVAKWTADEDAWVAVGDYEEGEEEGGQQEEVSSSDREGCFTGKEEDEETWELKPEVSQGLPNIVHQQILLRNPNSHFQRSRL
eukprot:826770-Pelagomonas_calceolata.AAC.1